MSSSLAREFDMQTIGEKSIGLDDKVFSERRAEIRRRVLKGALLSFNKGYSTFECVARNMSEHGAQLSLCETFPLPTEFAVRIDGQKARKATMRWRSAAAMGVELD